MTKQQREEKQNVDPMTYIGLDVVRGIGTARVLETVCSMLGLDIEQVKSASRKREFVRARQIYCLLAYNPELNTLKEVAEQISKKYDHATVLHSIKKIENECEVYKDVQQMVERIRSALFVPQAKHHDPKMVSPQHVGWYTTPERRRSLELFAVNHDPVTKMKA